MSNSAWFDLNSKSDIIKLHDLCINPKSKCQKQITFNPREFQLEGGSIEIKQNRFSEEPKLLGINF